MSLFGSIYDDAPPGDAAAPETARALPEGAAADTAAANAGTGFAELAALAAVPGGLDASPLAGPGIEVSDVEPASPVAAPHEAAESSPTPEAVGLLTSVHDDLLPSRPGRAGSPAAGRVVRQVIAMILAAVVGFVGVRVVGGLRSDEPASPGPAGASLRP